MQNGRAADLAGVLGEIFDVQSTSVGPSDLLAPGLEPVSIQSSGFSFGGGEGEGEEADVERPATRARPAASDAAGRRLGRVAVAATSSAARAPGSSPTRPPMRW